MLPASKTRIRSASTSDEAPAPNGTRRFSLTPAFQKDNERKVEHTQTDHALDTTHTGRRSFSWTLTPLFESGISRIFSWSAGSRPRSFALAHSFQSDLIESNSKDRSSLYSHEPPNKEALGLASDTDLSRTPSSELVWHDVPTCSETHELDPFSMMSALDTHPHVPVVTRIPSLADIDQATTPAVEREPPEHDPNIWKYSKIPLVNQQIPAEKQDRLVHSCITDSSCWINHQAAQAADYCWTADSTWMPLEEMASWLSGSGLVQTQAREYFFEKFDWTGSTVLEALRELCLRLYLLAETNKMDEILKTLSMRYIKCNPATPFRNAVAVHSVTYSLLLLNTDWHLADLERHMNMQDFVQNTKWALEETCAFEDVPETILEALTYMYTSIRTSPLELPEALKENFPVSKSEGGAMKRALSRGRGSLIKLNRVRSNSHQLRGNLQALSKPEEMSEVKLPDSNCGKFTDTECFLTSDMDCAIVHDPKQQWHGRKSRTLFHVELCCDSLRLFSTPQSIAKKLERVLPLVQSVATLEPGAQAGMPYMSIALQDGSIHYFFASLPVMEKWTRMCQYIGGRISHVPFHGGCSNIDYGWLHITPGMEALCNTVSPAPKTTANAAVNFWTKLCRGKTKLSSSVHTLQTWLPPDSTVSRTMLPLAEQTENLYQYIAYVKNELCEHEHIKESMLILWRSDRRARQKALDNWRRRRDFLCAELAQYRTYVEALKDPPPFAFRSSDVQGEIPRRTDLIVRG